MIVEDLETLLEGEVTTDEKDIDFHSRDTSLFRVKPEVVVFPKNSSDISKLVEYASSHPGVSLTARAGGTDMAGGPLGESIVMSFTKHINYFSMDSQKLEADVEPGVYYHDFEKETDKYDIELPTYPASKSICALGGMVMNNSGGEKTLRYGQTRKYVKA